MAEMKSANFEANDPAPVINQKQNTVSILFQIDDVVDVVWPIRVVASSASQQPTQRQQRQH
jgi:hypothetical protein